VGAELDQTKKEILLSLLKGQVFYASIQLPEFAQMQQKGYNLFSIERGIIEVSKKN
jgi:recombinational DNA repair ATPase RecF